MVVGHRSGRGLSLVAALALCLSLVAAVLLRPSAVPEQARHTRALLPRTEAARGGTGSRDRLGPNDSVAAPSSAGNERSPAVQPDRVADLWGAGPAVRQKRYGRVLVRFVREGGGEPVGGVRCLIRAGGAGIPRTRTVAYSARPSGLASFAQVLAGSIAVSSLYGATTRYSLAPNEELVLRIGVPRRLPMLLGRVLDPLGVPCAGAEVLTSYPGHGGTLDVIGVANAQGMFRVPECPDQIRVAARRPGYAASPLRVVSDWKPDAAEVLRLREARTLFVFVDDAEGRPVAQAQISLHPRRLAGASPSPPPRGGRTDEQGAARFDELDRTAAHVVVVRAPGYGMLAQELSPEVSRTYLSLEGEARYEGLVLDQAGAPVEGARLSWTIANAPEKSSAWTDAGGRFRLPNVPRSRTPLPLCVQKRGFSPATSALRPADPHGPSVLRIERF